LQVAVTRGSRLFNKNTVDCKPERVCIVYESWPVVVPKTWVQLGEGPLNAGSGPTRAPLSPPTTRRTHVTWTNSPRTPIGERSPCGALLQPVVVVWLRLQSVAGSLRKCSPGNTGGNNVTPANSDYVTNCGKPQDTGRRAVRLGRHPLEKVSRGPKGRLKRVRNPL